MRQTYLVFAGRMGRRLKQLRTAHGLTQEQLCTRLGILQEQYSKYETGKRLPYDQLLERLGGVYGLSPQDLAWGAMSTDAAELRLALTQGRRVLREELAAALAQVGERLDRAELEDLFLQAALKLECAGERGKMIRGPG